jgi:hypothetical protein
MLEFIRYVKTGPFLVLFAQNKEVNNNKESYVLGYRAIQFDSYVP